MHNLTSLGTASLDTMGGLITFCAPSDLPEGASPRTWDTDFIVGSVFTRAGLSSVYAFATTFSINQVVVVSGTATFSYVSTVNDPIASEIFLLSAFTGAATIFNGQSVTVLTVDTAGNTFTADVSSFVANLPDQTNLAAFATSTSGLFIGPKPPTVATQGTGTDVSWTNITGILGNTSYATVSTSSTVPANESEVPASCVNTTGVTNVWATPGNFLSPTLSTTVTLAASAQSTGLLTSQSGFTVPSDATIVGVSVSFKANFTVSGHAGRFSMQLTPNGSGAGTVKQQTLTNVSTLYTLGSSTDLWGLTTLTPDIVNASSMGLQAWVNNTGVASTTYDANDVSITVYYTTPVADTSEPLFGTAFAYAIPSTSGITGIETTFNAFSSGATQLTVSTLQNGVVVGTPKVITLTTTPTDYSLGSGTDLWGSTWAFSDINNTQFGFQFVASGVGQTNVKNVNANIFVSPALSNFNWVKTYKQNNNQTSTLALDAAGTIWIEDVTNAPGFLSIAYSGIIPGSYARSATADDQEYICFSDLSIGTDRPRVYNGTGFFPLSQVGPGAPPSFISTTGSASSDTITITGYTTLAAGEYEFNYTAASGVSAEQSYVLSGFTGAEVPFNGKQVIVGSPTFSGGSGTFVAFIGGISVPAGPVTGLSGIGTLTFTYPITSITQNPAVNFNGQELVWCAGVGNYTNPGTTLVFFYASAGSPENTALLAALTANLWPVYVFIENAPMGNGTWLVTGHGKDFPPSEHSLVPYFTVQYTSSGFGRWGGPGGSGPNGPGNTGTWEQTVATVTVPFAIPNISTGDSLLIQQVTGTPQTNWNGTWTVLQTPTAGTMNITSSYYPPPGVLTADGGVAQYAYSGYTGQGSGPANGQLVTITGCTNLGFLNVTGYITAASGGTSGTFEIAGFNEQTTNSAPVVETQAQAVTFGTTFVIDPGPLVSGTTDPIYGNFTGTGGVISAIGSTVVPIGPGTRQAVVFFITESGFWTPPSPPITFTTTSEANFINCSDLPIGPPNVIGRGVAFTEAGANGVPGANFYVIPLPVTISVGQVTNTYTSTIIWDNTSTTAQFAFTEAILLNSQEIDIPGSDLFNLIELGSSAWCLPYASRMFYGLQLNKVQNFNNLTFDGGFLSGTVLPLGWTIPLTSTGGALEVSPVTGDGWHIANTTGSTLASAGLISQTAFQDVFNAPILNTNTQYSVRVAASCPSGIQVGSLVISLTDYLATTGTYSSTSYGTVTIPLADMGTTVRVFDFPLLTTVFAGMVSPNVNLVVQCTNLGAGADCFIDRIEVYPTAAPYLGAQVYGSYINDLESLDATGTGGIIDTSTENPQFCMGGFVMHDNMFLLKTDSMYATEDNPASEPGGWELREVSNKVGTIGIHSYDVGEEWAITACRSGIYGFNGGQPVKLMQEIWNVWELINWDSGKAIVLRNDTTNRRILCAIPLPTPNQWLPFDPVNTNPTTPNVILMCNYQGLNTFEELLNSPEVHTTMFGTLAAVDMKRKWSIWRVSTPYMDFILRGDGESTPLFVCNGISSSKIYQFLDDQLSDDGTPIYGLYTTYGFVNAAKAATLPIFGFHAKRYTILQLTAEGASSMAVKVYPNTLNARYPYTVPGGITLQNPVYDDWFRPLNIRGNRCFLEFSTNAVGGWFQLHKILLSGKADAWATLNPTGGGNAGVV